MYYNIVETGRLIQQLRKEKGITQEEFAARLNITDRHLRRIESGEKGASIDIIIEISELCGASLDFIIVGRTRESKMKERLHSAIKALAEIEAQM